MILIGSKAIKHWYPEFTREGKDVDYAVKSLDNLKSTRHYEYLLIPYIDEYMDGTIATPDVLYTLKISHMFWDINWNKHLYDIQWLKEKNCKIIIDLFFKLYAYWNRFHTNNTRSDLKMNSTSFFNNALKCDYSHDWLHTLIKNPPTFTKILCDGAEVEVCEDKFNSLSFEEKLDLVQEEIYIMAWERMPSKNYRFSYEIMMKKFIISHAPLWEALFILDNYKYLYKPKINFNKIIENGIKETNSKRNN